MDNEKREKSVWENKTKEIRMFIYASLMLADTVTTVDTRIMVCETVDTGILVGDTVDDTGIIVGGSSKKTWSGIQMQIAEPTIRQSRQITSSMK